MPSGLWLRISSFLMTTSLFSLVTLAKFAAKEGRNETLPISSSSPSAAPVVQLSFLHPHGSGHSHQHSQSETFIQCHFNPLCYCKYDQRTEIYDTLTRLWQLVGFEPNTFLGTVAELQKTMKNDPITTYHFSEGEITSLAHLIVNASMVPSYGAGLSGSFPSLLEPGPIFDIDCTDVPIALIPTEYNSHGVISHVSVTGSKLSMLDGSAFAGLEIQGIRLSRDQLYFISEYAFSSMSNSLTMLDLSGNYLDEIPLAAFKTLKILEWLNLNNNLLNSVSGDWFFVSGTMRKLLLSANSIDSLPHKLFLSFHRLSWLDLSSNFIRNLSVDQLPPSLQTLNLMKNRFLNFPKAVLHLRFLSWLFLGGCSMERVPIDWPAGAGPLQMNQMDLSENFYQIWPSKPFGAQLTVLDLSVSKNYLTTLPAGAFHSMNIFRLSLGFNRIQMIDLGAFETLEDSLKYLNLENNKLRAVPWKAFANLTSLMHLYLGSNLLHDEEVGTPEGPDCKLTYLGLNGNQLSRVPRRLMSRCSHLFHLNLGYNQIGHLDDLAHLYARGRKLKNLSTLILRNNPIRSVGYNPTNQHHRRPEDHQLPLVRSTNSDGAPDPTRNSTKPSGGIGNGISSEESGPQTSITSEPDLPIRPAETRNVFRSEVFPNLRELSLSFCQLSGELEAFPSLPLTTLEVSMGLKSATTLGSTIFHALRNLEWLALDHNSLQHLSDYTFYSNRKLSYVNLEWNRIGGLPPQMFHPDIHQSITHLRLSHNRIETILAESFLSFPAINLDLSYNSIHTLERGAFSPASAALTKKAGAAAMSAASAPTEPEDRSPNEIPATSSYFAANQGHSESQFGLNLFLGHNRLSSVRAGAFSQERFAAIDLSWNQLSYFSFEAFGLEATVGGLNLSHNSIERMARDYKRRFFHLKFLDLSFNRITNKGMGLGGWLCVTNLLDFSHNRIDRVEAKLFPANCSVKELNLGSNSITTLDPGSFTNLRDLTVLNLGGNQISLLQPITFIRNNKLRSLDLSKNKIRSLPRDSLVGSSVELLDLSSNQFVNLPVGALSQIARRLKRLDMSHNSLEHLDSTMFESIPGLVHLNLSTNRLSILPDNAFANLASLRELDLSHNFLRANFKELFHFLPKLKLLRLASCGIKVLPTLPLPHLVSLDLSNNGMNEIRLQSLGSLTRLRHLDLTSNELTGATLPSWQPLYNLLTLKLSRNPLKSLTKDSFYGLGRLETLEILEMGRLDRFDSDVLSHLTNLRSLFVETYPNIEKYRFRLGAVLSSLSHLEELFVQIKEPTLSDQLLGGILPKLRKLTITGSNLRRIEQHALDGLQNCFHMELAIRQTSIEEVIPPRVFEVLSSAAWARLDLSHNLLTSFDSAHLYPNKTVWFSQGTKVLEGGLVLEGNDWACDCDLVWIGEWLRRWLRESFESHSVDDVSLVHTMYEKLKKPTCTDGRGRILPLIELYSDGMCHASALSSGSGFWGLWMEVGSVVMALLILF